MTVTEETKTTIFVIFHGTGGWVWGPTQNPPETLFVITIL